VSTGFAVIRPRVAFFDAQYCKYALREPEFLAEVERRSVGVSYPAINASDLASIPVHIHEVSRQRAIADYLDRETARIDALIAAKERLLGLLVEKRRALITRAVTRGLPAEAAAKAGLDPHAPLRDSGIPWLGKIPAHWEVVRLRFLVHWIEQGWSPQAENREPTHEEWGVLKLNAVNKGRFDDSAAKALPADVEPLTALEARAGDFLVTRSNTPVLVGDVCFVETTRPRLMLCDLIYRLALRTDLIDGRFLSHFLTLPIGRRQIEGDARGTSASMVKISQEHIKDWLTPLPPIDEQRAIVTYLTQKLAPIQRIHAATERTIALLKERRAALIAAVVTGQIDIGSGA
jgi:type I restriction enzyme S subunit